MRLLTKINFVLLFIFIILVLYLINEIVYLSNIVSEVSNSHKTVNDNVITILFEKLDSNFNLVLTTITVVFGLFAFLTFIGVKEGFRSTIRKVEKRIERQETAWAEHMKRINEIESDVFFEGANSMMREIFPLNGKTNKTLSEEIKLIEYNLVIADSLSKCLILKVNLHDKFKKSLSRLIKGCLSDAADVCKNHNNINLKTMGFDRYTRLSRNIEKVIDEEDSRNLASIRSKIIFPDLT